MSIFGTSESPRCTRRYSDWSMMPIGVANCWEAVYDVEYGQRGRQGKVLVTRSWMPMSAPLAHIADGAGRTDLRKLRDDLKAKSVRGWNRYWPGMKVVWGGRGGSSTVTLPLSFDLGNVKDAEMLAVVDNMRKIRDVVDASGDSPAQALPPLFWAKIPKMQVGNVCVEMVQTLAMAWRRAHCGSDQMLRRLASAGITAKDAWLQRMLKSTSLEQFEACYTEAIEEFEAGKGSDAATLNRFVNGCWLAIAQWNKGFMLAPVETLESTEVVSEVFVPKIPFGQYNVRDIQSGVMDVRMGQASGVHHALLGGLEPARA